MNSINNSFLAFIDILNFISRPSFKLQFFAVKVHLLSKLLTNFATSVYFLGMSYNKVLSGRSSLNILKLASLSSSDFSFSINFSSSEVSYNSTATTTETFFGASLLLTKTFDIQAWSLDYSKNGNHSVHHHFTYWNTIVWHYIIWKIHTFLL